MRKVDSSCAAAGRVAPVQRNSSAATAQARIAGRPGNLLSPQIILGVSLVASAICNRSARSHAERRSDSGFVSLFGSGLARDFSLRVQYAQPFPVLLHPNIRKIAFPWRNFAVPLEY